MTETTPPPATLTLLRRMNAERVLDLLRGSTEPQRVTELAQAAWLSRPTVDAVVDDLLGLGLVEAFDDLPGSGSGSRGRGRPARRYGLRADAALMVGVDIGLRKVSAMAADLRGTAQPTVEVAVEPAAGRRARLTAVRRAISAAAGPHRIGAIAVGVPGVVSADAVAESSVVPALAGVRLGAVLEKTFGCVVAVDNDANLAALGERWRGVAAGARDMVFILSGERLGAGIILGGELVRGRDGSAGEMGFLSLLTADHAAEGIGALMRRAQREMYPARPLREPREVLAAAAEREADAVRVRDYAMDRAARAVAAVTMLLAPELVVVGGAVADAGPDLVGPLSDRLAWLLSRPPRVAVSALGPRAVLTGAVRLALDLIEPTLLRGLGA